MMKKIRDAVSIVLECEGEIFYILRQNHLKAFPGYTAFPGGKVDESDSDIAFGHQLFDGHPHKHMQAMVREVMEELGVNLLDLKVSEVNYLGLAVTPDFNPHRFATYFYRVRLAQKPQFTLDENEIAYGSWIFPRSLLKLFEQAEILCVPPVKQIINLLTDSHTTFPQNLEFAYNDEEHVPMIETIKGVYQFMPLSNTLPPATRTNCFYLGDKESVGVIVDPSPRDELEKKKLIASLQNFMVDKIFITHHHGDHNEFCVSLAQHYQVPLVMSQYTYDILLRKNGADFFEKNPIEIVKEGDILTQSLGKNVLIMEVPGHDRGQLALYPMSLNWFIAGDLFQGMGTVVVGGEEGSMQEYLATLRKVIALGPKRLYPSHGICLGGTHILEKTLEHRLIRIEEVFDYYQNGLSKDEMYDKIYYDIPLNLKKYAMVNIESNLNYLKEKKRIS
jgi:glyoxylase-like metal-dependent hydrolase (beta-lactamase superfamily II)/8-oxo-dGTP pyrophosphatase MutT (NUDIX family)